MEDEDLETVAFSGVANSQSTQALRKNVFDKFELFRDSSPVLRQAYPTPWEQLTGAQVCNKKLYNLFATWLLNGRTMSRSRDPTKGSHLHIPLQWSASTPSSTTRM